MTSNTFQLSEAEYIDLYNDLRDLPAIDLKNSQVRSEHCDDYIAIAQKHEFAKRLYERVINELYGLDSRGYLIVSGLYGKQDIEAIDLNELLKVPMAVCGLIGRPLKVMDKMGLWLDLPVKLQVASYKFGGTGHNPLHMDIVNSTNPPDMVVLLSHRTDPLGGGQSLVSNMQDMVKQLSEDEVAELQQSKFQDGRIFQMSHIGEEYKPFPVLEKASDSSWRIRFTGKMIHNMSDNPERRMIQKLEKMLEKQQESFLLMPGQAIILNQRVVAHGRLPLGQDQESLTPDIRRHLFQMYMRFKSN